MGSALKISAIRDIEGFMAHCRLSAEEKHVIRLRYGIPVEEMTLDKVSRIFHITRERVRQIQEEAIVKMRKNIRVNHHFLGDHVRAA